MDKTLNQEQKKQLLNLFKAVKFNGRPQKKWQLTESDRYLFDHDYMWVVCKILTDASASLAVDPEADVPRYIATLYSNSKAEAMMLNQFARETSDKKLLREIDEALLLIEKYKKLTKQMLIEQFNTAFNQCLGTYEYDK